MAFIRRSLLLITRYKLKGYCNQSFTSFEEKQQDLSLLLKNFAKKRFSFRHKQDVKL
jgi:hypothetical protein